MIPICVRCCLMTLLIGLVSLHILKCKYRPHNTNLHWLRFSPQPTSDKNESYQNEIISKYRFTFEPIFVASHAEWHAVLRQPIQQQVRLIRSQWTAFVKLILKHFNVSDHNFVENASALDIPSMCVETLAEHERFTLGSKCSSLLERIMNVGGMPPEVIRSPNLMKTFDENNPFDEHSKIYLDPISLSGTANHSKMVNLTCDVVSKQRRSSLYRTLQRWIRFADENKILWWLSCGSLLGAVRDGNMIPYDSDVDISVLGSDEPKLRQMSTARDQMRNGQFSLVLRPGPHCISPEGIRKNCEGRTVITGTDSCAFCGPVCRIFYKRGVFIDVFPIHFEVRFSDEQRPIEFGYFDESCDQFRSGLHDLFPLKSCKFLGLDVPCPRNPARILGLQYGKAFMKPEKWCNLADRHWVKSV